MAARPHTCLPSKKSLGKLGWTCPLYTRTGWPALTTPMPLKIYLANEQIPDFGGAESVSAIQAVEIVSRYEVTLAVP